MAQKKIVLPSLVGQYVIPAICLLVGGVIGSWFTYSATTHAQEDEYRLHLAGTVRDASVALSDPKTALSTYAGLYALARPEDHAFKCVLMVIGYTAPPPFANVKNVLAEFIDADSEMQKIRDEPGMVAIAQKAATDAASTASEKAGSSGIKVAAIMTPDPSQVELLKAAVPRPSGPDTWMY